MDFYEVVVWVTILILLYLISLSNYLLFYTVVELFIVYVAYVIFLIVWKSRSRLENRYLIILGIGYFFVGGVDFLGTLAFHGMGVFPGFDTNLTVQLHIIARFLRSATFLIAPLLLIYTGERLGNVQTLNNAAFAWKTFLIYAVITIACVVSVFFLQGFPDSYLLDSGFTQSKIISGYFISFMLLFSLFPLYIIRDRFEEDVFNLLSISIILAILSELSFMFYSQMDEASNVIGLIFKLLSFYLIYKAIVDIGFEEPCSLFFRELKHREEDLRQKAAFLGDEYSHICRMIGKRYFIEPRSIEKGDDRRNQEEDSGSYCSFMQNLQGIGFQISNDFKITFMHGPVEEMTGYSKQDLVSGQVDWQEIVVAEDRPTIFKERKKLRLNPNSIVESEYRIQKKDGEIKWVREIIQKIPEEPENSGKFQGLIYDITERKMAEEALEKIDKIRIREVHHRIKNNLQVISSLLSLQAEKFDDKEVIEAFRESQNRVASIAMIHEKLHESESMDTLDFSDYLRNLTADLFRSYRVGNNNINLKLNLEPVYLDMGTAIPLGIIVNELISNAFKHAFPEKKEGEISINLCRIETFAARYGIPDQDKTSPTGNDCPDDNYPNNNYRDVQQDYLDREEYAVDGYSKCYNNFNYILTVKDNGKGIPEEIDFQNTDSLGLQLVNILVEQIDGYIELKRYPGTEYTICFNNKEN
ncbi:MASE3 domain-containing protein [Methanosarcina thermophila]|uniref:MASE3 domain-containing protein n=1 Tax=Methanosarcina thermophila TaxID=2210 RepID=UPI000AAECBB7|nr:MASE3 domain-containing protein [Methanosarcina thermophila]